jgi:hypothetical protein
MLHFLGGGRRPGTGLFDFGNFLPGVPETSHIGPYPRASTATSASAPSADPLQIGWFLFEIRLKLA